MGAYKYNGIISTFDNVASSLKEGKLCYGDEDGQEMRIIDNMTGGWGDIFPLVIVSNKDFPLPKKLILRWITLADKKCYELTTDLDTERMEEMWEAQAKLFPESPFRYVVVGIAAYGEVAIWLRSSFNAVFFQRFKAEEVEYNDREKEVFSKMPGNDEMMRLVVTPEHYERVMQQYKYRYVPLEEYFDGKKWVRYSKDDDFYEQMDILCVEDKRVDGTFDFTDDDSIYQYHTTGMPQRITVKWTEGGVNYFAHFKVITHYVAWFFESFHEKFPETPVDLLIRLDTRANKFEVAMTAGDLIPRAFIGTQYIVFRNDKEIARSENFSMKEKGWFWE